MCLSSIILKIKSDVLLLTDSCPSPLKTKCVSSPYPGFIYSSLFSCFREVVLPSRFKTWIVGGLLFVHIWLSWRLPGRAHLESNALEWLNLIAYGFAYSLGLHRHDQRDFLFRLWLRQLIELVDCVLDKTFRRFHQGCLRNDIHPSALLLKKDPIWAWGSRTYHKRLF